MVSLNENQLKAVLPSAQNKLFQTKPIHWHTSISHTVTIFACKMTFISLCINYLWIHLHHSTMIPLCWQQQWWEPQWDGTENPVGRLSLMACLCPIGSAAQRRGESQGYEARVWAHPTAGMKSTAEKGSASQGRHGEQCKTADSNTVQTNTSTYKHTTWTLQASFKWVSASEKTVAQQK